MKTKTWVEVSKRALTENVRAFRVHTTARAKGAAPGMMAVIKSNAYGHGLTEVAETVKKQVDWFGVDSVDEGRRLRKAGIKKPVLVLGYTMKDRLADLVRHDLSFVVYDASIVLALRKVKGIAKIHLKLETGTARQGLAGEELRSLAKHISKSKNIVVEGAYTHFANVEEDDVFAKQQIARFVGELAVLKEEGIEPKVCHAACSAAALTLPDAYFDLFRLGISMYGLWPSEHTRKDILRRTKEMNLQPALSWKTVVAQVKSVKKGTPVGYGLTEKVTKDSTLAVLPIGYWDGYDRHLSGRGYVLIGGKRCKIVGRICMNMCMADVTAVKGVKPEDEVVLIGSQGKETVTAEELAGVVGTINYEIVTRINPTIPRTMISNFVTRINPKIPRIVT